MADDGWSRQMTAETPGPAGLRQVLADLGGRRTAASDLTAVAGALELLAREVAAQKGLSAARQAALSQALDALARRIDGQGMAQARLAAQVADTEVRLDQRLDAVLEELAALRAAAGAPSRRDGLQLVLAAAGLAAGLSVLAATGLFLANAPQPPHSSVAEAR